MTTGQPIRFQSDRNKFNNEYAEALQLQINLNQTNLEVNRLYKQTGQLPASTQMMDTRSSEEKLMDVHYLRQQIVSDLRPIAEPAFANAVVTGVTNSPLNVDNTLFRYLAQNGRAFAEALSKKYRFGIAGDANDVAILVQFLEDAFVKTKNTFQSVKGYINSNTNEGVKSRSNTLSANDTDNIKNEIKDIIKRLSFTQIPNTMTGAIADLTTTLAYLDRMLPTSDQMQKILQEISNVRYADINYANGGLVTLVLEILTEKMPKLSSVQTLVDRLERAIKVNDIRNATQSINGILRLFSAITDDPDIMQNLVLFHNEFVNRAERQVQIERDINQVQTTQAIQAENANERAERNAQRVYIVNPPGANAVHVQGPGGDDDDGSSVMSGLVSASSAGNSSVMSGLLSASSAGSNQSGFSGLISAGNNPASVSSAGSSSSSGSSRSGDSIPSLQQSLGSQSSASSNQSGLSGLASVGSANNARDDYIVASVNQLTQEGTRRLANQMERSPIISQNDKNGLIDMLRNINQITVNDQKDYIISILVNLPDIVYDPSLNMPVNFFGVGGRPGISGLGLKKPMKGRGLYSPFGDSEINHKNLEKNILTLRRKTKTNYMDLPSKHISNHMKNIVSQIMGGKIANYDDMHNLNDEERNYLHKVVSKTNLHDRLSVPAPSKDQADKDNHQWEVMRGEIMAGNDSKELVKKFKILTLKLTRQGLLPKNEVMDLFEDLVALGY